MTVITRNPSREDLGMIAIKSISSIDGPAVIAINPGPPGARTLQNIARR